MEAKKIPTWKAKEIASTCWGMIRKSLPLPCRWVCAMDKIQTFCYTGTFKPRINKAVLLGSQWSEIPAVVAEVDVRRWCCGICACALLHVHSKRRWTNGGEKVENYWPSRILYASFCSNVSLGLLSFPCPSGSHDNYTEVRRILMYQL